MSGFEFVQRGKVLIVKKQYQDAVKVCRLGLLAHPTLVEGRLVLGMALMALARFDEVLAEMRVALELDKQSPLGHLLKGEALLRKGDLRQANEVLGRAKELDPLNEKVVSLLDEVRRGKDHGLKPGQAPPSSFSDPSETKMYPAHSGAGAGGRPVLNDSSSITLPAPDNANDRPSAISGAITSSNIVPPPEILAVGDKSSTIVLDSKDIREHDDDDSGAEEVSHVSAVEIVSSDIEDMTGTREAAPAPEDIEATVREDDPQPTLERRPGPRAASGSPAPMRTGQNVVQRAPSRPPAPMDLRDAADEDSTGERDNYVMVDLASTAGKPLPPLPLPSLAGAGPSAQLEDVDDEEPKSSLSSALDSIEQMIEPDDYQEPPAGSDYDEGRERSRRISRALSQPGREGVADLPGEGGPTRPAKPASRRTADLPERAGPADDTAQAKGNVRPPPSFEDDDMDATSPAPIAVAKRPSLSRPVVPAPVPMPTLPPRPQPPPSSTGMNARAAGKPNPGVKPGPGQTSSRTPSRTTGGSVRQRARRTTALLRRGLKPWMMGVIALAVVIGAIGAGLLVREQRVKRRIRELSREAVRLSSTQTYRAYAQAEANYRTILEQRNDSGARAALARVRAAAAYEFGDPPDEARALLEGMGRDRGRDAACARVYLALALADGPGAVRAAREAVASFGNDAETHYLLGRALLEEDDVATAADELGESIKLKPTPLALIALGLAEQRRFRPDSALVAFDEALRLSPEHPGATIERARLLAAIGKLPEGGEHPEAELTAILREGAQAPSDQPPLVSRAQLGWASLALAEVLLARGELAPAKGALAAAAESRPIGDRRFAEALFLAYLAAGDLTGARAEAERAVQAYPGQGAPHVWLARAALAEGKPEAALAELDKAGAAGARPEALALRGQAKLMLGDLDGAGKDLAEALSARPEDRATILAMATVELQRGDAKAAAARVEPLYKQRPDAATGVVLGAALRGKGDRARARQVLEEAVKSPRGKAGWIELARLHREEGRYAEAGDAYARAMEGAPRALDARLEAATLAYDRGNAQGARESIDRLAQDAPDDAAVLLECGRLHVATGDPDGAQKCLDAAARLNLANPQKAMLAREKGRLALARRNPAAAAPELKKAIQLWPEDAEARLLLIDASLALDDTEGLNAQLTDFAAKLPGAPELDLGKGRVHLALGRTAQAIEAFAAADKALAAKSAAPRLVADAKAWLGRALYFNSELPKARATLEEAVRLDPGNADAHYYLGLLLYDQNMVAQARAAFQRAVDSNAALVEAWFYLGDAAFRMGDRPKAREALRVYLKLAPKGDFAGEARRML